MVVIVEDTTIVNEDLEVCKTCSFSEDVADLGLVEDDEFERRPSRRPYQEPTHLRIRKMLLAVAESVCLSTLFPPCARSIAH